MNRIISRLGALAISRMRICARARGRYGGGQAELRYVLREVPWPGGKGDGPAAATLSTSPRNFTDCAAMGKISDDTMFNVIKNGGAANGLSKDMQAWNAGFEDGEMHDLVAYIRTFCKK